MKQRVKIFAIIPKKSFYFHKSSDILDNVVQKIHTLEKNMIQYPKYLDKIFNKLENSGARCLIIGGFIRDYYLNVSSKEKYKDIDIEIYNIASFEKLEELLKEFGNVNSFGKSFGVCKLRTKNLDIDFTLPRVDSKISFGHTGFDIQIDLDLDYATAMRRRDFTINAIGYEVQSKKIIDPFHGLQDLNNKILRAVDLDKFSDDPLRVLRAIVFCARFDLTIDTKLFKLSKKMVAQNVLSELPKERIFEEMKKLLLKSSKPSMGLELLKELDALKLFPELDALQRDDWEEILQTVDAIAKQHISNENTKIALMLAGVCYKLNSIETTNFITKLTNEKKLLYKVLSLTQTHLIMQTTASELFKLATKVVIKDFIALRRAIDKNKNDTHSLFYDAMELKAKNLKIFEKKAVPLLMGRDILACGIPMSKEFSTILRIAYEAQMDEQFSSHEEAILWLKNYLVI